MDREIKIKEVKIREGLLYEKRKLVAGTTVPYIKRALNNEIRGIPPSGAFENFRAAAGLSAGGFYGLVSQDSDLFKWVEAACLAIPILEEEEGKEEDGICRQIKKDLDQTVELLSLAQQKDGYLNSYYILNGLKDRWNYLKESCQLYCAGHLMEAAVAGYEAAGDMKLLDIARKYADCIDRAFGPEQGKIRGYDGHAEVEVGLYRMYGATRISRYRKLADFFVEERGRRPWFFSTEKRRTDVSGSLVYELEEADYRHSQSHLPVRQQTEAVGHAVKAMYFYTAAAWKAGLDSDRELYQALKGLWNSVTKEKMYLTGGIGACEYGESFSYPFDLPPDLMYGETCASIGLFLFAYRMLLIETDSCYGDVMERTLYNGILAGMSESGTKFFYTNALEIDPEKCEKRSEYAHLKGERQPWFDCPCCPPNIARLLLSVNKYIYTIGEKSLNVHLFAGSVLASEEWTAEMKTKYPDEEDVFLHVRKNSGGDGQIRIRVPGWCEQAVYTVEGKRAEPKIEKGYAIFPIKGGETLEIRACMPLKPVRIYGDVRIKALMGKAAVMRGPVVYCAEERDNEGLWSLFLEEGEGMEWRPEFFGDSITAPGRRCCSAGKDLYTTAPPRFERTKIRLIPYRCWNNRGKGAMRVFFDVYKPGRGEAERDEKEQREKENKSAGRKR